jgi:GNAT superfamily N-acetyltransferase
MTIQIPTGFTARPATLDDLQTAVEVMNAVTQADVGKRDFTAFTVGRYWQSDDMNLSTDTLLIFALDGRAAGFAQFIVETPPTPYDVDTWAHPTFVNAGVGEALLQWIDQRAEQALLRAPADVPASLEHVYVYAQNRAAQQRLEQFGYTRERTFYRMAIEFDGPPPEPRLPQGISIRAFQRGVEERVVYDAFVEAQADEWGQDKPLPFDKWLYYFIEVEENFDPEAWFLAVEGETIVGYALCRWDRAGEPDGSTVRYLAVRRPWRKRGIALALLHAAFGSMYRHGKRGAGLGVDATSYTGADRLYVRAGMRRAFETLSYRKVLRGV